MTGSVFHFYEPSVSKETPDQVEQLSRVVDQGSGEGAAAAAAAEHGGISSQFPYERIVEEEVMEEKHQRKKGEAKEVTPHRGVTKADSYVSEVTVASTIATQASEAFAIGSTESPVEESTKFDAMMFDRIQAIDNIRDLLKHELRQCNGLLAESTKNVISLEEDVLIKSERIEVLEKHVAGLKYKIGDYTRELKRLSSTVNELVEKSAGLSAEKSTLEAKVASLEGLLKEAGIAIVVKDENIAKLRRENGALLNELNKEKADNATTIEQIVKDNAASTDQLEAALKKEKEDAAATIRQIERDNAATLKMKEENNAATIQQLEKANAASINRLENALEKAKVDNSTIIRQMESDNAAIIEKEMESNAAAIHRLKKNNAASIEQIKSDRKKEKHEKNVTVHQLKSVIKTLKKENEDNAVTIQRLEQDNIASIQQFENTLKKENAMKAATIHHLESNLERLEKRLSDTATERERHANTIISLESILKDTENSYREQVQSLEKKNKDNADVNKRLQLEYSDLRVLQKNALSKLTTEHEDVLARMLDEHKNVVTNMKDEHDAKVAGMEIAAVDTAKRHEATIIKLAMKREAAVAEVAKENSAVLAKMKEEYSATIVKLQKDLEAEADANTAFAEELADVTAQVEDERVAASKAKADLIKKLEDERTAASTIMDDLTKQLEKERLTISQIEGLHAKLESRLESAQKSHMDEKARLAADLEYTRKLADNYHATLTKHMSESMSACPTQRAPLSERNN